MVNKIRIATNAAAPATDTYPSGGRNSQLSFLSRYDLQQFLPVRNGEGIAPEIG